MLRGLLFFNLIILLCFSPKLMGSTYYVDASGGNDENSGLLPDEAWKTIHKINFSIFNPGDNILFKSGETWREQLIVPTSGTPGNPIVFGSYGTGEKPVLSGSEILTEFTQYSAQVWKTIVLKPQQVFFDNIRGALQLSRSGVNAEREWFYDTTSSTLYIYSAGNPLTNYAAPGIEVTSRGNCIYLYQDYITFENLQMEKTFNSAVNITEFAENITLNNITFYQWSNEPNWEGDGDGIPAIGGVDINGSWCTVSNSTFGKKTGDDLGDQNWAGFVGIHIAGANAAILNNNFFHNGFENEVRVGDRAIGVYVSSAGGLTEIANNYFYHNGGHSILLRMNTLVGDTIKIHDNIIEYPGQAGISAYATRGEDGVGGVGLIYRNHISFANRLGADWGSSGNQSSGIHFNDGNLAGINPSKPFMKYYVYENIVHNSQALKKPNGLDSDGIGLDFNANGIELFRNIIYNNWGKGIYLWNANRCKVYNNIVYGNDAGSTITAATGTLERAEFNEFYNNTFYKNYNGDSIGPNYHTEIYFGGNGKYNVFKNNIFYGHEKGVVYYFRNQNTIGCITDNNLVFKEGGSFAWDTYNRFQTFEKWKENHPDWDRTSIFDDPLFINAAQNNFELSPGSPAIDKGLNVGIDRDFKGYYIYNAPDIGAFEYNGMPNAEPLIITSADIKYYHRVAIKFSKKLFPSSVYDINNYTISNNIVVVSANLNHDENEVILGTSEHTPGENYSVSVQNLQDNWGNPISPAGSSFSYSFIIEVSNNVSMLARDADLSDNSMLKTKSGSAGSQVVFCSSENGEITFKVSLPDSGIWYAWARMFYELNSLNNSFYIRANNDSKQILGDNNRNFDQWHWDGFRGERIRLGYLSEGEQAVIVSGREPGSSVLIDEILLTRDPFLVPYDSISASFSNITLSVSEGIPSGEPEFKTMQGSISGQVAYFSSDTSSMQFRVNIPVTSLWYAWGRMLFQDSSITNKFFVKIDDGEKLVLDGSDIKYNKWLWKGYQKSYLDLGEIEQGEHTLTLYGSNPAAFIDLLQLSTNPEYIPYENTITEVSLPNNNAIINTFELRQNYPNPFNPKTNLEFQIPSPGVVTLIVYDVLGNEIDELLNEEMKPGKYNIAFDASNFSSGVYFYALRAGNFQSTKKMILLK